MSATFKNKNQPRLLTSQLREISLARRPKNQLFPLIVLFAETCGPHICPDIYLFMKLSFSFSGTILPPVAQKI